MDFGVDLYKKILISLSNLNNYFYWIKFRPNLPIKAKLYIVESTEYMCNE